MNRNQEMALQDARPEGHGATEGRGSPIHRVAECTCGWRHQVPRRGRNALATTSMLYAAMLAHYRANAPQEMPDD